MLDGTVLPIVLISAAVLGAAFVGGALLRLWRQIERGERSVLRHPFRMVRAVALVSMAPALWWTLDPLSAEEKIAASLAVAVACAMLAIAGLFEAAPRRIRHR
jgi:hypothetical protein